MQGLMRISFRPEESSKYIVRCIMTTHLCNCCQIVLFHGSIEKLSSHTWPVGQGQEECKPTLYFRLLWHGPAAYMYYYLICWQCTWLCDLVTVEWTSHIGGHGMHDKHPARAGHCSTSQLLHFIKNSLLAGHGHAENTSLDTQCIVPHCKCIAPRYSSQNVNVSHTCNLKAIT